MESVTHVKNTERYNLLLFYVCFFTYKPIRSCQIAAFVYLTFNSWKNSLLDYNSNYFSLLVIRFVRILIKSLTIHAVI